MAGRVFVTGGSGFVGSAVIEELLARGFYVHALVNRDKIRVADERVRIIQGDLFDPEALDAGMKECDAAIHLVGIIREKPAKGVTFERIHYEGTQNVVSAAIRVGIQRYLHMSALGVRADAQSTYHKTKYRAELSVQASGLAWTIFRPSMIHGPEGEFMRMEAKWARKLAPPYLFMPYFGKGLFGHSGAGMLQPVYVKDVARAFIDALDNNKTIHQSYELGGLDRLTWPEMHRIVSQILLGKSRAALPIPAWWAKTLTCIVPGKILPFNRDQVIMSQENNTCDLTRFEEDFGWRPRGFEETLKTYANAL